MTVFLVVSELSRVSSQDLNQSISLEAGQTGTYAINVNATMGLSAGTLAKGVAATLALYSSTPPVMIETITSLALNCPPQLQPPSQPVVVLRDTMGEPLEQLPGTPMASSRSVCLGGQEIPSDAVHVPTRDEEFEWFGVAPGSPNSGLLLAGAYEGVARLDSSQDPSYTFVLVTNRNSDESQQIQQSLNDAFTLQSSIFGLRASNGPVFDVARLDTDQAIRSAASGVDLVYTIIAWGILILGGLGVLVAENIVVRDRMWFFGLARAIGGRGKDIAALVLTDIALVVAGGTLLALALAMLAQPIAQSFAESTFQVSGVTFLNASTVPRLFAGDFFVLVLAGTYPALRAMRQDPLDVLEPRVS